MENIITTLLTSSLLVAFIELIKWKKDTSIEHITHERKIWRKEVRNIAKSIGSANAVEDLNEPISQLKVRINPKGIVYEQSSIHPQYKEYSDDDYFLEDGYLWNLIWQFEHKKITKDNLGDYKNKFINNISLLLKYDWEKSKNEILFGGFRTFNMMTCIVLIIVCGLILLTHPGITKIFSPSFTLDSIKLITFAKQIVVQVLLFMITPWLLIRFIFSSIDKKTWIISSEHINKNYTFFVCIILYIIVTGLLCLLFQCIIDPLYSNRYLIFVCSLLLAMLFMYCIYEVKLLKYLNSPKIYVSLLHKLDKSDE